MATNCATEKTFSTRSTIYQAALKGEPSNASVLNKIGICQLMMQRYKDAKKSFERAIKADRKHADAYNNLGVIYYSQHSYGAAIKQYEKAISLRNDAASYYNNLGAAYFAKKQFDKAIQNYSKAVQLDPDVFERSSHAGVQAQLPSPEDRAHYDYVLAKLYARTGAPDRSLHYLKKAHGRGLQGHQRRLQGQRVQRAAQRSSVRGTHGGEDRGHPRVAADFSAGNERVRGDSEKFCGIRETFLGTGFVNRYCS